MKCPECNLMLKDDEIACPVCGSLADQEPLEFFQPEEDCIYVVDASSKVNDVIAGAMDIPEKVNDVISDVKERVYDPSSAASPYKKSVALILALLGFIGLNGLHRMYVGKVGTGLLYLLTAGFYGIGTLVDVIMIAQSKFQDSQGRVLDR